MVTLWGILSSCSHQVAPTASAPSAQADTVVLTKAVVLRPIVIDTADQAFHTTTSAIGAYWNAEVSAKSESLYKQHNYRTLWFYDHGPSPLFSTALNLMKTADVHGLDPSVYVDNEFESLINDVVKNGADARQVIALDRQFTDRFLLFTTHLSEGKVITVVNGKSVWKRAATQRAMNDVRELTLVYTAGELIAAVDRIAPQSPQYARLKQALAAYRAVQKNDVAPISIPSALKPGERSAALPQIRRKVFNLNLAAAGAYSVNKDTTQSIAVNALPVDSLYYDSELSAAVQSFQRRHGLTGDGVIGDRTLRYMNQRISDYADQIALNMDRLRWTPTISSERYLLVNIPDYKLTVYEGAQRTLEMRVIVGSANTPTPVFNDQLNHIVFSPTWTVPVSIVRKEIIPNLRKDSTYYSEKNFVIYKQDVQIDPALENWKDPNINPYQLRVVQNPGADNSLGSVKFMMPNNMSVYLHDTPSRRLFARDYRALSHGCVRLGEPAKLAAYLLRDQQGWDAERITKAMSGSSPATILLKQRYPVYLTYQTAWVDDNGSLQFREDIYGHDKMQLKQLRTTHSGTVTAVAVSAAGM